MRRTVLRLALSIWPVLAAPVLADEAALAEAIGDYMDFATEAQGIILAQQIDREVFEAATFIDTRSKADFEAGHIQGATHIEWRSIPARIEELPQSGIVILYCNTGVRSSQATFAARLMGRDNVLVLQGGYEDWMAKAAYLPE